MSGSTTNLHLRLPDYTDNADVGDINWNMETIDGAIKTLQTGLSSANGSISSLTSTVGGKVSKSGDTMTGNITVQSTSGTSSGPTVWVKSTSGKIDSSANNGTSTQQRLGAFGVNGSNGNWVSLDFTALTANSSSSSSEYIGSVKRAVGCRNMKTNGSYVENWMQIGVKKDGTRWYSVSDAAAFRNALGLGTLATKNSISTSDVAAGVFDAYLPKSPSSSDLPSSTATSGAWPLVLSGGFASGGKISYASSMSKFLELIGAPAKSATALLASANRFTTNQYIKFATVDSSKANNGVSADVSYHWAMLDKNDRYIGNIETTADNDGSVLLSLLARNFGTGSNVNNGVYLRVNNDGTRAVSFSDATAWRDGMGASNASNLTSGTVPYARLSNSNWAFGWGNSVSVNHCRYRKVGHVCYVEVGTPSGYNTSGGTAYKLCTLPSGYRPSAEADNCLYNWGDYVGVIWVDTAGNVYIKCNATNDHWYGSISYPVA